MTTTSLLVSLSLIRPSLAQALRKTFTDLCVEFLMSMELKSG